MLEKVVPLSSYPIHGPIQDQAAPSWWSGAVISEPMSVLAVLLGVLALIFLISQTRAQGIYRIVPLLVFCYFVPTALSNTGVIPGSPPGEGLPGFPLYGFIMDWLLPGSLLLLILAVDVVGIAKMGRPALLLFLTAVGSVALGGPLAYLALGWMIDAEQADQAWRGLAALSGSWIGGGANFASIGKSVGAGDAILGVIIVVDVAVANCWMIALLYFADRSRKMDASIGADSSSVDRVQQKAEEYFNRVAAPTDLPALLVLATIAIGGTVVATVGAGELDGWFRARLSADHWMFEVMGRFTWKIILVTIFGLALSFVPPVRRLEGKGASKLGAVFLYLLVASIGAKADFAKVFDAGNLPLVLIGAVWMAFHASAMLLVRRLLRAPIFFVAVGSKACIGGAASAPIVAAAFSPSLAPVGALLAIGGYVFGTIGGIVSAFLLGFVNSLYHGS